jgi:hypothetical protein
MSLNQPTYMWQQWVNAILGIAIIAVPFIGLTAAALTWTLVVGGVLVAILAVWSAMREQSPEYHQEQLRHSHSS